MSKDNIGEFEKKTADALCYAAPEVKDQKLIACAKEADARIAEQHRVIDELKNALKPFANFACSPPNSCACMNCMARDLLG